MAQEATDDVGRAYAGSLDRQPPDQTTIAGILAYMTFKAKGGRTGKGVRLSVLEATRAALVDHFQTLTGTRVSLAWPVYERGWFACRPSAFAMQCTEGRTFGQKGHTR